VSKYIVHILGMTTLAPTCTNAQTIAASKGPHQNLQCLLESSRSCTMAFSTVFTSNIVEILSGTMLLHTTSKFARNKNLLHRIAFLLENTRHRDVQVMGCRFNDLIRRLMTSLSVSFWADFETKELVMALTQDSLAFVATVAFDNVRHDFNCCMEVWTNIRVLAKREVWVGRVVYRCYYRVAVAETRVSVKIRALVRREV
jgi:hypothetical protein